MTVKKLIVIPCHFDGSNNLIFNCVRSIRKKNPDIEILIVDSDSPDKSYFSLENQYKNITIADVNNKNYDTGAFWYAYRARPDIEFFYMIHDSLEIHVCIEDLSKKPLIVLRTLESRKALYGFKTVTNARMGFRYSFAKLSNFLFHRFVYQINMSQWLHRINYWLDRECNSGYGFSSPKEIEWFEKACLKVGFHVPLAWMSVCGPIFFCSRSVLEQLESIGFDQILPSCKSEQTCMERLWGLAFLRLGLDFDDSLQGDHFSVPLEYAGFKKTIINRQ